MKAIMCDMMAHISDFGNEVVTAVHGERNY